MDPILKRRFISNWGESVAIIWSTAARLFLLSCHQPLLRSSGLPCPDFQMLPAQLSTRKRMTKSASLPLIFHLHTWIKQQGPNGLKARMVGRDLHICCVFTYLEISWAKRRGKGDWWPATRQRFGKSPKFHRKLFQMVYLHTNAHKYRTTEWPETGKPSQRIKHNAGILTFAANKKKGYTKVSSCYRHPKYGKWEAGLHLPSAGSLVLCITPAMKRNETRSCPVEKYDPRKGHPVT